MIQGDSMHGVTKIMVYSNFIIGVRITRLFFNYLRFEFIERSIRRFVLVWFYDFVSFVINKSVTLSHEPIIYTWMLCLRNIVFHPCRMPSVKVGRFSAGHYLVRLKYRNMLTSVSVWDYWGMTTKIIYTQI